MCLNSVRYVFSKTKTHESNLTLSHRRSLTLFYESNLTAMQIEIPQGRNGRGGHCNRVPPPVGVDVRAA